MSDRAPEGQYAGETLARRPVAGLLLAETRYAPGRVIPFHAHSTPLVAAVTAGSMVEERGRRQITCEQGAMIYQPPDEEHGHRFEAHGGACFIVQFGEDWVRRMDGLGLVRPPVPLDLRRSPASWLVDRIRVESRSTDGAGELAIEGFAVALLAELGRAGERTREGARPGWLIRAEEMLVASLDDAPTMADIAAAVGVHPVHLSRTFRRFHGCTMGDHLRRLRVRRAADQLRATDRPLSRIALEAGFSDQAHFSRVFRRVVGQTPSVYRALTPSKRR